MNKPFLFLLILSLSLSARCFASEFKSAPLPEEMQSQLVKSDIWNSDCPVQLKDLSLLTFSYYDFAGEDHDDGQIIVNQKISAATLLVFKELYARQFPISSTSTLISLSGNWREAENQNITYGFVCYHDETKNFSADSYGRSITINPVENPELSFITNSPYARLCNVLNRFIDCEKIFPSAKVYILPSRGILSVNRSLQLKGMVDSIASIFKANGFIWQGDSVQHISWKKFIYSEPAPNAKNN